MKKLAIYARKSGLKNTTVSIEDQINKGNAKALELRKPSNTYVDMEAAFDGIEKRRAFKEMLKDIKAGEIDSISVADCSRLTRNSRTYASIKKLFTKHNIIIYSRLEGIIDFNSEIRKLS